jgi:hypothetical protein
MIGGFFCVPSTKKRSTAKKNADKSKKAKKDKSGKNSLALRKYVRGAQQGGTDTKKRTSFRKTSNGKTKTNRSSLKRSNSKRKNKKSSQRGGATIEHDLTDMLGRGSYPVTKQGHDDCSGVHHK